MALNFKPHVKTFIATAWAKLDTMVLARLRVLNAAGNALIGRIERYELKRFLTGFECLTRRLLFVMACEAGALHDAPESKPQRSPPASGNKSRRKPPARDAEATRPVFRLDEPSPQRKNPPRGKRQPPARDLHSRFRHPPDETALNRKLMRRLRALSDVFANPEPALSAMRRRIASRPAPLSSGHFSDSDVLDAGFIREICTLADGTARYNLNRATRTAAARADTS